MLFVGLNVTVTPALGDGGVKVAPNWMLHRLSSKQVCTLQLLKTSVVPSVLAESVDHFHDRGSESADVALVLSAVVSGPVDRDVLLTPRELEVLTLLAEGMSNKAIARRLGISVHTAKFHVGALIDKLDAVGRTDAVAHAARRGVIHL